MTKAEGSQTNIMPNRWQAVFDTTLAGGLAVLPLVCIFAPRFAGPGPVLLALVLFMLHRAASGQWLVMPRKVLVLALVFPALMALSALWGINPDQTFVRTLRALPVFLAGAVLFVLAAHAAPSVRARFARWLVAAVLAGGVFCAFELHTGAHLYYWLNESISPDERFNLSRLNRSAAVFVLCAIPAFYCAQQLSVSRLSRPALMAVLAMTILLVLIGTKSQSVQLAALLALVMGVIFPLKTRGAWAVLAGLIGAMIVATPWIAQYLFAHLADLTARIQWLSTSYMPNRMEIWDFVTRRALERPWLGHGVEATRDITDFQTARLYHNASEVLHPHNFAAQLWIEFGLLGALLGAGFLAVILHGIAALPMPTARYALASFIACLSIAATAYGLWQSWWIGLFVILIAMITLASPRAEAENDAPA